MKAFRSICLCTFALACLVSCNSPTSVAEKALEIVGRGTFVPTDIDRYAGIEPRAVIMLTTDYGNIFDNALRYNYEALDFRKTGTYKEHRVFYFSDVLFEKYELISKEDISITLYGIDNYARWRESGTNEDLIMSFKEVHKMQQDYQESGDFGTWIVEQNVPMSILRYKLDNRYIANISVLKCPNTGYRVCAFRIE